LWADRGSHRNGDSQHIRQKGFVKIMDPLVGADVLSQLDVLVNELVPVKLGKAKTI
jgi:hypothetical protein